MSRHFDDKDKSFDGRDVGSALVLISVGILLFLNTTGVVDWGVWGQIALAFLRLWPLYLVLGGLHIIFGGSNLSKTFLGIAGWIVFAIIVGTAVLSYKGITPWQSWFPALNWNNSTSSSEIKIAKSDYPTVTQRDLNMVVTAGKFTLTDINSDNLIDLTAKYPDEQGVPYIDQKLNGETLDLNFTQKFKSNFMASWFTGNGPEYDFTLGATSVNTALDLTMTAGDGVINLGNVKLGRTALKMTAGNLEFTIGKDSLPSAIQIELTAGNMTLNLPKDVRLDVDYELTAGSVNIDNISLDRRMKSYTHNAVGTTKVTVLVKVTAGNLNINFK